MKVCWLDSNVPVEDATEGDEEAHCDGGPGSARFILGLGDFGALDEIHCEGGRGDG
jgi:hypothetical protein